MREGSAFSVLRLAVLAAGIGALAVLAPKYLERLEVTPSPATETVAVALSPAPAYLERRVVLLSDAAGHYTANAVINGRSLDVLVDTGATTVALSSETARRLGLAVPNSAYTVAVETANGRVRAAQVMLEEVRIGEVRVRDVPALVLPVEALGTSLLGMTFLKKLRKFESAGDQMILTQ